MANLFNLDEENEILPEEEDGTDNPENPDEDLNQEKIQKIKRKGTWRKGSDRRQGKDRREKEEPVEFDRRDGGRRKEKRRKKDKGELPFQK